MVNKSGEIKEIRAREILDSRGTPTVEATVELYDGTRGVASVPSGASVGKYEAMERRDSDSPRYNGKSVLGTARGVEEIISPALVGKSVFNQAAIDHALCDLDGTETKAAIPRRIGNTGRMTTAHRARVRQNCFFTMEVSLFPVFQKGNCIQPHGHGQ